VTLETPAVLRPAHARAQLLRDDRAEILPGRKPPVKLLKRFASRMARKPSMNLADTDLTKSRWLVTL
jgi:hypothetical protein